ncbi:FtsW/RodA/SpoVE family cell cycle protein [Moraxella marmotae]|uniref:FtsW/RodA/SpoVE family cell cycle protein n=1 Tax=Moraxella marmotae TaxID=3344520 RepID=UPI0035F2873A
MSQFFDKILKFCSERNIKKVLLVSLGLLIGISLLMIASASVPFATSRNMEPLKFFWSQLSYVSIGLLLAAIIYRIPLKVYYLGRHLHVVILMWIAVIVLLGLTAMFGEVINGSRRWLSLKIFNLQAAELAKAVMVFITADYVVRRSAEVRGNLWTGSRLIMWYAPVIGFLIAQPDFGTLLVILSTLVVMVFVSGAPLRQYGWLVGLFTATASAIAWLEPYRRERILSFTDAFDDLQGSDYQLARSLIAYGRGQFSGLGYGNSVQKLSHLPEAHTDFLLAITGEEFGFLGVGLVLALELLIIFCIICISLRSLGYRQLRLSYTVFGFAVVIFGQVIINAGMTMGLAPTKGLTMPFFSFGGSSIVVLLMMIGFVLRVEKEGPEIYQAKQNDRY